MNRFRFKMLAVVFLIFSLSAVGYSQTTISPLNPEIDKTLKTVHSLIRIGEFQSGLMMLDRLKMKFGEDTRILSMYKNLYTEAKMYPELEKTIRTQLSKSPKNPIIIAELGNARFLQDDSKSADSLWNLALTISGTNQAVYMFVASYKLRYGDYEGAINTYLDGRKKLGKHNAFYTELAAIYEAKQDYASAVAEYINGLNETPASVARASIKIRGILDNVENYEEIIKEVKKGLKESDKAPGLHEILGDLYIKIGRMDEALKSFKTVGNLRKDDGESIFRFASRCYDFKVFETAIIAVDDYLKLSKKQIRKYPALLLKAKSEMESGRYQNAVTTLQTLRDNTKDIRLKDEADYITGFIFSNHLGDCDTAIVYWKSALKSMRRDDLIRRVNVEMGYCFIKNDDLDNAEKYLMKTATLAKPDINYDRSMFLLGEIHLFKHDYKKASDFYTNLIRSKPGGDYTNNALERLSVFSTIGIDDSGLGSDNSILDQFSKAVKFWTIGNYSEAALLMRDPKLEGSQIAEQTLFYSGMISFESGDYRQAEKTFGNYLKNNPEGFFADRSYLALGDIYINRDNDVVRSVENYNKILELFPNSVVIEIVRERLRDLENDDKIG